MGVVTLWDTTTKKPLQVEPVDAREILANNEDGRYTSDAPEGAAPMPTANVVDGRVSLNLQSLSVGDLRVHANKLGADLEGLSKRDEIIAAIEMKDAQNNINNPAKSGVLYPPAGADNVQAGGTAAKNAEMTPKNAAEPDKKGKAKVKAAAAADDEGTVEDDAGDDLEGMTVADLKATAETEGVELEVGAKKADIAEAIRAHRAK